MLQEHCSIVQFKYQIETHGAYLPGRENLELLRSLVEVISKRDRVMQFENSTFGRPAFQVDRLWRLKNATCCWDMYWSHAIGIESSIENMSEMESPTASRIARKETVGELPKCLV